MNYYLEHQISLKSDKFPINFSANAAFSILRIVYGVLLVLCLLIFLYFQIQNPPNNPSIDYSLKNYFLTAVPILLVLIWSTPRHTNIRVLIDNDQIQYFKDDLGKKSSWTESIKNYQCILVYPCSDDKDQVVVLIHKNIDKCLFFNYKFDLFNKTYKKDLATFLHENLKLTIQYDTDSIRDYEIYKYLVTGKEIIS